MAKVLAGLTGISVWVSLGTLMVTDDQTLASSAALPPLSWLVGLVIAGVVLALVSRLSLARALPLSISFLLWLPFLPLRIPAVFLVWSGPLKWAVWMAVLAGVVFQIFAPYPRRAPVLAGIVAALAATAGFIGLEGTIPGGDEPHYLIITQSLLRDGDLQIENNHARGDYRSYTRQDLRPDYIVRGKDGNIYSIHPPGVAALVIPGFAIAGYRGAVATIILSTALASTIGWLIAWWLTANAGAAWFAWAAVFLTTPFFFHEFTIYPDGAGALLAVVAIGLLVRFEMGLPISPPLLVTAGASLALLPWFHTRFAVLAASCGLVILARLWSDPERWRQIAAFAAAPIAMALAWFGYFWIIWGTPNPAVPYGTATETALANIGRGAPGLLFDQQFGLIANAPVYALAVVGWFLLARRRRRLAIELLVVTAPYFLATAAYHMWWGGVSPPARFITCLMPAAVLPLAWWWREQRTTAMRACGLALLLLSIAVVIPRALVDRGTMVFNDRDGFDLLLNWASTHLDLPMAFPGLHRGPAPFMLGEAGVWGLGGALLLALSAGLARTRLHSRGATWTAVAWASAVVAMSAATLVWTMNGRVPVTPGRSQVAAIARWQPDWQTTTVRLRPFRSLGAEEFARQIEIGSTDRVARRTPDDATILHVSWLPAGDYDIVTKGNRSLGGELFLWTGKTELPTDRWRLEGRQPGFTGLVLSLPVPVYAATLRGDPEARAAIAGLALRLRTRRQSPLAADGYAIRGIRYESARAFFMDENAYMEPNGFWTRGDASATVVADVAPGAAPPTVWVQSGPIATSVTVRVGAWQSEVRLDPQERKSISLPPSTENQWALEITSGAAFRPTDFVQGNGDSRPLGVWVELR